MAKQLFSTIEEEVQALKTERGAILLAHNYQAGEIQDVADCLGDSLLLAQSAVKSEAKIILFAGVRFMAETTKILAPEKMVLLPDLEAGCSLADMVTPEQVREWKKGHPHGVVLSYINTSAAVKAESDYCCTSTNAERVLAAIPEDKEVLFIPDFFLGSYLKMRTKRPLHLWKGYCPAHAMIDPAQIVALKTEHPKAEFVMHPECGCLTKSMHLADRVTSTDGMIRYVHHSPSKEFIVATETGILHRMRKENPDKTFYAAGEQAVCSHMKRNTLEKIVHALEALEYQIEVPQDIARHARLPLQRMMAIG
ncbi:MAG: quinolinate synthase NadA [Candidatus Omnitrophica bacterium]|nr:quinolinate synthase NadA [Candidatus Omnitrophota bacterium]